MKVSKLFAIYGFIIFIGGAVQFFIMLRGAEGFSNLEGDLSSQVIYLSVYLISFVALLLSKRRVTFGIIHAIWFWLLVALTCLSFLWSSAPEVTIRQAFAIIGTTLFSIYLVHNFEIQEYVKLLAISLLITIVSSYLVIFLLPNLGISHIVGSEWRGIFTHKNHLGGAASLSVLIFFYLTLITRKGKWIWIFGLISSVGLLIGCKSAAAIMVTVFIVGVMIILYWVKQKPLLFWEVSLGVLFFTFIFVMLFPVPTVGQILNVFGKEETLTGRVQLWDFCMFMAEKKPLLGYGYGAFWLGQDGPSAEIWPSINMGVGANHCHNGFIELVLAIGLIGLLITMVVYWVGIKRAAKYLTNKKYSFSYAIFFILLIWILPYNLSEQALLYRNSIFWVIISSVILYQVKYKQQIE